MAKRTSVNWSAMELQYVNSSVTYRELAEKYGVKEATVRQHSKRHNWAEKRHAVSRDVTTAAQARVADETIDALAEFNRDDLKIAKALRAQVATHIAAGQRNNGGLSVVDLRSLASAAETAQRIGRLALGAATNNNTLTGKDGGPLEYANVSSEELADAVRSVRDAF